MNQQSYPIITNWPEAAVAIVAIVVAGWVLTTFIKALK
jgi:hypothetical protein